MRPPLIPLVLIALIVSAAPRVAAAKLAAKNEGGRVSVAGEHFRLAVDAARGGQIVELELFDGTQWNRVLGADGACCPALRLESDSGVFDLDAFGTARIEGFDATDDRASWTALAEPNGNDAAAGPWRVTLRYEVYAEGALFIDMDCELLADACNLKVASIQFAVDRAMADAPKFRQSVFARPNTVLPAGRIALGMNPRRSYTNEIAVLIERSAPLGGKTGFAERPGGFVWRLADAPASLEKGYRYRNRIAIGLSQAASGKPRTNLVAQRVYHWINYLDRKATVAWFPTDNQIDRMAAGGATMLILHQDWMLQGGSNGDPHADYAVARDDEALRRVIAKAHARGMRVGLYRRAIERYDEGRFFEKYLQRNRDGMYVDWHGPHAVAEHEMKHRPETGLGDTHFSHRGERLAARDYFQFARRLRDIVGPRGFLIGHMGFGSAGVFANLTFDAYLPGEDAADHAMFRTRNEAVFRGMLAGSACMPWPVDAPAFTTPETVAKMAAWGFFPHVGLGIRRAADKIVFPLDPDAPENRFALPYWRLLASIDVDRATVHNLPSQSREAIRSSNPAVEGVVYAEEPERKGRPASLPARAGQPRRRTGRSDRDA